jgi:glycosyltransferase involved in cell wall biosynthesis
VRIAFHAPRGTFLDPRAAGGDSVVTRSLIDALTARDHEVEVVSRLDARDLFRGRLPVRRLIGEALSIRRRMRAFAPDAWLIYGASVTYPDLFGWWLQPGRYVLYAAHKGKKERLPRRWRWLFVYAHRRALARADGVTVVRPANAARLRRVGVTLRDLQVLPSAPRPWTSMPTREEARRRLDLPAEAPVVLCLARFPKRSRLGKTEMVITLLRVLTELPEEVLLLLVGDDGPGRPRVDDEIARLGLQRRIRYVGPKERRSLLGSMSNDDVPWFFAAADVYAYPHPLDQPWLSLLEAQACARPVVTMRTESSELLFRHGETGLLAGDVDEFRLHLGALLDDPERRTIMGRAAYEDFSARHSMEHHLDRLEGMLFGSAYRARRASSSSTRAGSRPRDASRT